MVESKSRLQRSEVRAGEEDLIVVFPQHPGRELIRVMGIGADWHLSPEEAYAIGNSIVEHAIECGYDPETGETHPVD